MQNINFSFLSRMFVLKGTQDLQKFQGFLAKFENEINQVEDTSEISNINCLNLLTYTVQRFKTARCAVPE